MKTFDYIVIGAGSAGCVVANRLSAGGAGVLVLEAGGSDRKLEVRAPAAFAAQFQTAIDWNYTSDPEPALFGRRLYLPRGKVLGGCSSMNCMLYIRGNRADYDGWAGEFGATGWSYDEVLPSFKRSEDNAEIHDEYHGTGGELRVTRQRWMSPHGREFVDAAVAVGLKPNDDFNGATQDGAGVFQTTTKEGRRWSTASAFLRPVMKRPNVEVRTGVWCAASCWRAVGPWAWSTPTRDARAPYGRSARSCSAPVPTGRRRSSCCPGSGPPTTCAKSAWTHWWTPPTSASTCRSIRWRC